jgi:hypothetical protein
MLSISASIFDPLGFIAPVTAKIKTIFQLLCKDKLDKGLTGRIDRWSDLPIEQQCSPLDE